jgi:hypothetical protein
MCAPSLLPIADGMVCSPFGVRAICLIGGDALKSESYDRLLGGKTREQDWVT